jgi:hypothetical protein
MLYSYSLLLFPFLLLFLNLLACVEAVVGTEVWADKRGITPIYNLNVGASATMAENKFKTQESNPYMVVENQDKFPAPAQLTFSNIQVPWNREGTPENRNHNKVKLSISNKGIGDLIVSNLKLSDATAWKLSHIGDQEYIASSALPITVKAGSSKTLTVEFIAKNQGGRVKVLHGSLYISSNDAASPEKEVKLHGLWQRAGEGNNEPYTQEIIEAFGFKTNTGYSQSDGANKGETAITGSDEVISAFFVRADASRPVEVIQLAAYHGCCSDRESFRWYSKGSSNIQTLFTHNALDGQSLLPRENGSSTKLAQSTFNPTKPFGFRVAKADSDRNQNHKNKIGMRIWKAIDADGNIIPNAYIIGSDYLGTDFTNYDYQDNVYFVRNIRPETGKAHYAELAATPSAVEFEPTQAGRSTKLTVNLKNLGQTYPDGSSDPAIQIKSMTIAGPNQHEFAAPMPAVTALPVQGSAEINIEFKPTSPNLKNAALLVHFTNGASPLRIPLYGVANSGNAAITAAKRIKSAADAAVTIGDNLWEADKSYRKGSIKLDKQLVSTPIAATDDDLLYQTYLSADKDLAETSYVIPIEDGNYVVRMHFVENYWSAEAARVFNIIIEDQLQLANLDIYKEVGYRTALVKDFEVTVTGGALDIDFNPAVNRVAIAGLEIFQKIGNVTSADPETELEKRNVLVYPNPVEGKEVMVITRYFDRHEEVILTLHDVSGKVVYIRTALTDNSGYADFPIDITPLHQGIYIVQVNAPSGKTQHRLLIK